jgi:4'-phosphopantetheinyl transferase EntD
MTRASVFHLPFSRDEGPILTAFSLVSGEKVSIDDVLSIAEKNRYDAFLSPARKAGFLNGRVASKSALSALVPTDLMSEIEIYNGVMYQPLIRESRYHGFQVSLSHSGDVAVAVAYPESHPIGIDIERHRPSGTSVIAGHVTEAERQLVTDLAHSMGYTMLWSARESVSKLLKTGMVANPLFYQVKTIVLLAEGVFELTFTHLFQYKALCFVADTYVVSLCFPKKSRCEAWGDLQRVLGV